MDEQVIRNDKTYISTSLAADLTGYARDYVGQLARDGYYDSTKIGRKRFVDREEFIAYALKNKSELSISDLPDNHVSDDLSESVHANKPESEGGTQQSTDNETNESKDSNDEQALDNHNRTNTSDEGDGSAASQSRNQSIIVPPESAENGNSRTRQNSAESLVSRVSSRWQRRRDGSRNHQPTDRTDSGLTAGRLRAAVFAGALVVMVFTGIAFGVSDSAQNSTAQNIASVSAVAERAYDGVGVGLNQKLADQSPLGVVIGSVSETASLVAEYGSGVRSRFAQRMSDSVVDSGQYSGQKASAASVAGVVAESVRFLGDEINRQFGWVGNAGSTQAVFASENSYFPVANSRLAQAPPSSRAESGSPKDSSDTTTSKTQTKENQIAAPTEAEGDDLQKEADKAVVVPAPTSTEARKQTEAEIREQFSDPVEITASTTNSGVVQPQFGEQAGDQYMYVMVPTNSSSSASTRAQE